MTTQYNPQQPQVAKVNYPSTTPVKRAPAPGQSPVGGTTSLGQSLQSPASSPFGESLGSAGSAMKQQFQQANQPAPAPAPAPPASTPPGSVPPPPPPMAGALAPTPGGQLPSHAQGQNSQMGDQLFQHLMEMLNKPSGYGSAEAQKTREMGTKNLQDQMKLSEDKAKTDAASRGMYYSTGLTNSLGDIGERYNRGLGDMETNIQTDMAKRQSEDQQRAIELIFGYGDRQNRNTQQENDLWLRLQELGLMGGPNMPNPSGPMIMN